ncbi:restriction endonuclease subunit S [Aliivibrio logei]|uniref:restriction endonuclease subunit S n=1 Tax=Aliivibrio logei TaxID=688 RepID=UPI0035C8EAC8
MVPNGWSNTCIDDNITFSGGAQPPREVFKFEPEAGYIRLIQIRDYKSDKFITYIPQKLAKKFCSVDDVMIGRYGPPIFQILRGIEGAYNVALIKAIPKFGVDKEFMYYFLKRDPLLRVIESYSQRTSGQTGIEMDVLKAYPMHLPPLPEQRKIAQILSTWDKAITTTEKLINASKQQKKALMQQLLTGKKRLVDPETGKAFEGEWELSQLKNCVKFLNGQRKPIKQEERANIQGQYPYYGATGIIDYVNDYIFDDELILLGEDGENILSRVLPHVFVVRGKVWINNHAHVFKANKNMNTDFLCMYLESLDYKKYNSGSAQPKINKAVCEKIPVMIPLLKEQQKIASVLTTADKDIELLNAKLSHFKQEKKALMQQLLTGKKRVQVEAA